MFFAAIAIDSTTFCVASPISASLFPSSVSQFSHAALSVLSEPSIVDAPSSAVVPVMPSISCTSWMACTWSEKLSIVRSPARPCALSYSLAVSMRRCISAFVPP